MPAGGRLLLCYDGSDSPGTRSGLRGLFHGRDAVVLHLWESWAARRPPWRGSAGRCGAWRSGWTSWPKRSPPVCARRGWWCRAAPVSRSVALIWRGNQIPVSSRVARTTPWAPAARPPMITYSTRAALSAATTRVGFEGRLNAHRRAGRARTVARRGSRFLIVRRTRSLGGRSRWTAIRPRSFHVAGCLPGRCGLEGFAIHDLNDAGAPDGPPGFAPASVAAPPPTRLSAQRAIPGRSDQTEGRRFESCRARVVIAGNPVREAGLRPV